MRSMPLRRLSKILEMHRLAPVSVRELICYTDQQMSFPIGIHLMTIQSGTVQDERQAFVFKMQHSKEDKKAEIVLTQAAQYARKADGRPILAAGTQIIVTLTEPSITS